MLWARPPGPWSISERERVATRSTCRTWATKCRPSIHRLVPSLSVVPGIRDVRLADLRRLGSGRRWDTVLLMCGNLGLAGARGSTRQLLTRLAATTTTGGLLIGDSVDPEDDDPHVRLRLRYGARTSPWWEQINIPPSEIEALVEGTGWRLEEQVGDGDGYAVVLRRA